MTSKELEDMFVGTVTVGERGQIVIPAEARKQLDIHSGDRLFVMAHQSKGGLALVKMDAIKEFLDQVRSQLDMIDHDSSGSTEAP